MAGVVVIGGGPAGALSAALLARAGRSVLLLEREPAAHDKVCGEFISAEACAPLAALGLDLAALGAQPVDRVRLIRGARAAAAKLPFRAFSLSRRALDEALLARAAENGAEIRRGVTATALTRESEGWRVETNGETLSAPAVFLATGKHNLRGWPRPDTPQGNLIGFKLHYRLLPAQREALAGRVELFLFNGGYGGLEPIEDNRANLCLVVSRDRFAAAGKNWDTLLRNILRETPPLAARLAGAAPCHDKPLAISGIPYGFVHRLASNDPPALYRLGDQMAVIPSFAGDGMAIALHTARLAVKNYLSGDAATYHAQARRDLLPLVRRASRLSALASYSIGQSAIITAGRLRPSLLTRIASRTRLSS